MKATGIIRRMDDLGRVVIPKELRRSMKIKEGAPLEIYTHNGAVCFKPYLPIGERDWEKAKNIIEVLIPYGFTLLDYYGGEQATVKRDAEVFNLNHEIRVGDDVVGYLVLDKNEYPNEVDVRRAVDVLQSLFADAV